jgi:hypothetical protein
MLTAHYLTNVQKLRTKLTFSSFCISNTCSVTDPDPELDPSRFMGLPDPDPDPLVKGTDTDPDPSIIKPKKVRKILISTALWLIYDFLSLKNDVNVVSKSNKQKYFEKKYNF